MRRALGLAALGLLAACTTVAGPVARDPIADTQRTAAASPVLPPFRAEQPLVILISIDGFRFDYLDRGATPTLSALAADGVRTDRGMRPSFPSVTFPNHYTLVTGLRPDRHGIVANTMDDLRITPDTHFTTSTYAAVGDARWWDEAEPIWVSARRAGVRTATFFWPGSEAAIRGVRPDRWAHFDAAVTPDHRVDHVLDWLDAKARPGFLTLYFDQVDTAGHEHGPDSPELMAALRKVDAALARLVEGLTARGLYARANLVIVADHGMMDTPLDRHVFVEDWAPAGSARLVETGANAGWEPRTPQGLAALLAPHAHAVCRRKGELPAALHFGANPRVPPVYCRAEPGWYLTTREADAKRVRNGEAPIVGEHGYDSATTPQMAALFVAHGPAFRPGYVQPSFDNVDVQPLLARLLDAPAPVGDGALAPVAGMLRRP